MNSVGSFSPPSFYSSAPSRGESARPTVGSEQSDTAASSRGANPSSEKGNAAADVRGVNEPISAGPAGTEREENRLQQTLSGKETELELVEQTEIRELAARDREVRAHEQAHMAVGGQHAGGVSYDYSRGPDGRLYATGGSVSIDISPVSGDPTATIDKMQQVQRAALAPAEPSGADRAVAAQAAQMIAQARAEIATRNVDGGSGEAETDESEATAAADTQAPATDPPAASGTRELATYRQIDAPPVSNQMAFRASA